MLVKTKSMAGIFLINFEAFYTTYSYRIHPGNLNKQRNSLNPRLARKILFLTRGKQRLVEDKYL